VEQIRELELVSGESAEAGFDETIPETGGPGETPSNMIDEKLQELLPPDEWVETPRQMDLTALEGNIVESLLGVPSRMMEVDESSEVEGQVAPAPVHPATVPIAAAIADLDDLMGRLHDVRHTYARQLALPSSSDHQDCRELLIKLGVPVVTAMIPYEAEGLASALAKEGIVDFVGTEDSDVLAYEVGSSDCTA
jgi:flap endonuclease-1